MKKLKKHEEKTKKIESQNLQSSLNKLEIGFEPVFREQNPKTVIFLQKRVEFLLQKRYNN